MIHPIEHRYGSVEMRAVFDDGSRWRRMINVEVALAKSLAKLGAIPGKSAAGIAAGAKKVKIERIKEIEKETQHDVMAMVKALSEQCGKHGKYVHLTATSYDIVDTALALQMRDGLRIVIKRGESLLSACARLAKRHEATVMVGRTHGQHATPITLGFKFANYADKLDSGLERLRQDMDCCVRGKFSGAVGSYAAQGAYGVEGRLETEVMRQLGIKKAEISTQVVGRENFARIVCDLAIAAATAEQMGKEVRNLQRTEIGEAFEAFGSRQVGSSTMAQKKNPWNSENVCGNARVVRSCVMPAIENIALEHERDLTNSACERSIIPTAFLLTEDIFMRMDKVLRGLVVDKKRMMENLEMTKGGIMAESVMTALVRRGMGRQEAHEIVRQAAMESSSTGCGLKCALMGRKIPLCGAELDRALDPTKYTGRCKESARRVARRLGA